MTKQSVELDIWDYDDHNYKFNQDQWVKDWQNRCGNCLAPCCFLNMQGESYKEELNDEDKIYQESKDFFSNDFVIIQYYYQSWEENTKVGFNIQLNPPELKYEDNGLRVCPLAIPDGCMIYEDRPLICRKFYCGMKWNEAPGR